MADYLPQATGNWSTTTWITAFGGLSAFAGGNTPPTVIDDVYADGKGITIDTNIFVNSLRTTISPRTGGLAGGGFFISNGISLTAISIIVGTSTVLTFLSASPNSCNIRGNITGGTTGNTIVGLNNNSSGTVTISGNHIGGSSSSTRTYAILNTSTGTINVIGAIRGGTSINNPVGLYNASTGTVNITGTVLGGTGANAHGVNNQLTGSVNISGSAIGGTGGSGLNLVAGGNVTFIGTAIGGSAGNSIIGIRNGSTATVNITGSIIGGPVGGSQCYGVQNASTGSVFVVGSITGGTGNIAVGFYNQSTGAVTISGSITGGTGSAAEGLSLAGAGNVFINGSINGNLTPGIVNGGTATVLITGNVLGGGGSSGFGITNSSAGVINLSGTATGGIAAAGLNNTSTGTVFATRVVGNGFGLGSAGIGAIQVGLANSQNGKAYVEQVEFGPRGATPISGPVYILPSNRNTLTGYTTALGTPVTFYNSLSVSGLLPPVSSVQAGVIYNVGNSVGTMAVPSASAVQFGVPVDNTIGTAALQPQDVWGYARLSATQVDSMGDRLRNTATTQSIGYQIASFNL